MPAAAGPLPVPLRAAMTASPEPPSPAKPLIPWEALTPERQLELREAYGRYLDSLPRTCSLDEKNRRFSRWLAARGVAWG